MPDDPGQSANPPAGTTAETPGTETTSGASTPPEAAQTTTTTGGTTSTAADASGNPIKSLRDALDAANKARKDAEAKLREMERAQLSETERLRAELEELKPLREEHGRFASTLESLYQSELSSVPEEKREQVETLSRSGSWADRLDAIRAAKALLPEPTPTKATPPATTTTNPPNRGGNNGAAPLTMEAIRNMSQEEVIRRKDEIDRFLESQRR